MLFLLLFWESLRLGGVIPSPQVAASTGKLWAGASKSGVKNSPQVLGPYVSQHRFAA